MIAAPRPQVGAAGQDIAPPERARADELPLNTPTRRRTGAAYDALAEHLKGVILSGEIPSGARLPTERALASHYHVARVTIRAAFARLQVEGLVSRRTRVGTVVLTPPAPRATHDRACGPADR